VYLVAGISRRGLFPLLGGAALLTQGGALRAALPQQGKRVAVIGAGIIGASIAYHLARDGAKVTVLEKERPAAGATGGSFAWLNAGGKRPHPYYMLNLLGILGWHRLQTELGHTALPMQWNGCVQWRTGADVAQRTQASIEQQLAWGYPSQMIDAARLAALMPGLTPGVVDVASYCPAEGTVNPRVATEAMLTAAKALGAKVESPVSVTGFDATSGTVRRVLTAGGALDVDAVVIAAGLDSMPLSAMLGALVPIETSPGILAHTEPGANVLPRLAFGAGANMKQPPDGGFVTGSTFAGTPDLAPTRENGEALLTAARAYVPALNDLKLDWVSVGHRVLPKDSFPIVGHLPGNTNAYVAAMHSGMSMAPLIGELAATEVLGGPKAELLSTFRPDRFVA